MNKPPRLIPLQMKLLGILWALASPYLLYGVYGNWVTMHMYPEITSYMLKLGVFFGLAGLLSLVVAVGMFRPRKAIWYLALVLCPGIGWYFLSILPGVLFNFNLIGSLMALSYLALYAATFVFLFLPASRALFGMRPAQTPTKLSSELPTEQALPPTSP